MSEKTSIWAIVAAVGSLIGGVATFMALSKDNAPQVQPAPQGVATLASNVGAPAPQTPDKPPPADEPLVRQASLSAAQHAELQQLVEHLLDGVQQNFGPNMTVGGQELASLQPGASYNWNVNLNAGVPYRIIGACDNECSDVNIQLVDGGGAVVSADTLPDDFPVVDFTPPANGAYQVRILMQTCTIAPCYAGARILSN
jgi:hypothetical protein